MPLEFTIAEPVEELLRASPRGLCPLCGVQASPALPVLSLWDDDGDVVFEGCPACLDGRVAALPEAQALLRVVLVLARGKLPGPEVATA